MSRFLNALILSLALNQGQVCWAQIPGVKSMVIPQYPELAILARLQGTVVVSVEVVNGKTTKITIDPSTKAHASFHVYTQAIIERWVFRPGFTSTVSITFDFRLLEPDPYHPVIEQEIDDQGKIIITAAMRPKTFPKVY